MGTKERLLAFISHLGMRNAEFERVCGLSNGFIANTNDRIRKASLNQIGTAFPQLNVDWVITGNGEMLKSEQGSLEPTSANADLIRIIQKLVEQGEAHAEANKMNAEANLRNSRNLERLIEILNERSLPIEKAAVG